MTFPHDAPDFDDLLRIVAQERKLALGLVEKDYWVTHTLWAIHAAGFEVWFKGGTSLSKGFKLIERFSEDLDLKIEPGTVSGLRAVSGWKSEGTRATAERKAYFEQLPKFLSVPGAHVAIAPEIVDRAWRSANFRVTYPGRHLADLGAMAPFVLLEVGSARVTPCIERDMTSFVHERLTAEQQPIAFQDNTPKTVRCVHPLVTLLEKLDALHRRFPNDKVEPAKFVRHFEDAAHVIGAAAHLPQLPDYSDINSLAADMLLQKQLAVLPSAADEAFIPDDGPRWQSIRAAHAAIGQMFWGSRIPLENACTAIREWAATFLP